MNNIWIRSIAILEIVGGIVGILFIFYVAAISDFGLSVWIIAPISLGIFILSLVAGILLWKGRENGRKASIIVQFIQLPKLVSPALIFMYSFGFDVFPHITLVKDVSNVGIQLRFLADGQLFFNSSGTPLLLGVSVPSIIALVKLWNFNPNHQKDDCLKDSEKPPGPEECFASTDNAEGI